MAENIKKVTHSKSEITYNDAPKKRYDYEVERRVGNSGRLKTITGSKPQIDLLEGLKQIYSINYSAIEEKII